RQRKDTAGAPAPFPPPQKKTRRRGAGRSKGRTMTTTAAPTSGVVGGGGKGGEGERNFIRGRKGKSREAKRGRRQSKTRASQSIRKHIACAVVVTRVRASRKTVAT